MKVPSKRRKEEELRQEWTARLNRFAAAKTDKQRQAALEPALKINPGGALRGLLEAWGYSASSRGRKARSEGTEPQRKPGREQLEAVLEELYGKVPSPVPNLNKKLAGTTPTTVKDACRIVSSLVMSWPEVTTVLDGAKTPDASKREAKSIAELLIRDLLSDLSGGRSREWSPEDMEIRVFNLIDEQRVGVSQFIAEAGKHDGALIVAGARNILIGTNPIDTMRDFHGLTSRFIENGNQGLLIFVFDAALFVAGDDGYSLLYNMSLLSAAITAFSFFDLKFNNNAQTIQKHKVDWSRWRTLSKRCCAVVWRPTVLDPATGEFLIREKLDEFIAGWSPKQDFARLDDLKGFVRFDGRHVLPKTYPSALSQDEKLIGRDLYWDVIVRPASGETKPITPGDIALDVEYFTPPFQTAAATTNSLQSIEAATNTASALARRAGRPPIKTMDIEEDFIHVIKRSSPGALYDDAQRAIYMAARGRLNLDSGDRHLENLNAAAALRQTGYEVLPISILISLFPRTLHFAAFTDASVTSDE